MVDSSANLAFVANPLMTRGKRLTFDFNAQHIFYAVHHNLVARAWNNELTESVVYTNNQDPITSVKISRAGN